MHWTDSQVDLLIALWTEGKSPLQIASRLAGRGRDSVLEKIQLLQLGRRAPGRARTLRTGKPGQISAGRHSHRFRFVLAEQARRRVERRTGEEKAGAAARPGRADRRAEIVAGLLTLEEQQRPRACDDASVVMVQRLRGWSENPAPVPPAEDRPRQMEAGAAATA